MCICLIWLIYALCCFNFKEVYSIGQKNFNLTYNRQYKSETKKNTLSANLTNEDLHPSNSYLFKESYIHPWPRYKNFTIRIWGQQNISNTTLFTWKLEKSVADTEDEASFKTIYLRNYLSVSKPFIVDVGYYKISLETPSAKETGGQVLNGTHRVLWPRKRDTRYVKAINTKEIKTNKENSLIPKNSSGKFYDKDSFVGVGEETFTLSFIVANGLYSLDENVIDKSIQIFYVDLEAFQMLGIIFTNVNLGESYDVVFYEHNKPSYRHFSNKRTVVLNNNGTTLTYHNFKAYRVRLFIAFLPSESMLDDPKQDSFSLKDFNVDVTFFVSSCFSWNNTSSSWESICKIGVDTATQAIHCQCDGLSASFKTTFVIPQNLWYYVEKQKFLAMSNGMLLVFLVVSLLVYMIALIFGLGQRKAELYYLSDNLWSERYAYLIKVKTGFSRSAGTTSNITIKIKGTAAKTRPHVLNFPDPHCSLLQRQNEDYFILTTEKHLGEIQVIQLWHDSVGFSPTWQCEQISIFDFQIKEKYVFRIRKNFRVTQRSSNYCIAKVNMKKTHKDLIQDKELFTSEISGLSLSWYRNCTLALSTLNFMIVTEMGFTSYPTWDPMDVFVYYSNHGFARVYIYIMAVSAVMSIFLHLSLAYLFRNSAQQFHNREVYPTQFGFKVTVLCWVLLIFINIVCVTYVICIDIWINVFNVFWVAAILVSFFVQICIYFKAYAMLRPCYTACTPKAHRSLVNKDVALTNVLELLESQRYYIHSKFGGLGLRPYLTHLYAPTAEKNISVKKLHDETLVQLIELIEDILMFTVYMIVLHYILYVDKEEMSVYSSDSFQTLLKYKGSGEIINNLDMYEYINQTFLEVLFLDKWYDGYELEQPVISDAMNALMVPPRIRLINILPNSCFVAKAMAWLRTVCAPEFDMHVEDRKSYLPYWKKGTAHKSKPSLWTYITPQETGSHYITGTIAGYPGGGYVVEFIPHRQAVKDMIVYLKKHAWISLNCRFVAIDMLLYNVHSNTFLSVTILMEKGATGYVKFSSEVISTQWLFVNDEILCLYFQAFFIAILWIALLTFKKMSGLTKSMATFFKDIWNAIDLTIILTSVICIALMTIRLSLVNDFISRLETVEYSKFIPYRHMLRLEQIIKVISLLIIICAAVRLWKLLRFGRVFRTMETTLLMGASPLLCGFLSHIVITAAFSIFGMLTIGPYSSDFEGNIGNTVTNLLLLSVNLNRRFDYQSFKRIPYGLGYIYVTVFLLIMLTLYNIYKTIVIMSYTKAKQYFSNELAMEYTTKDYIKDNFLRLFRRKTRLKGGASNVKQKVFPKADEFRFANGFFVATQKMMLMEYITLCYLRNKLITDEGAGLSDYDTKLITHAVDSKFGKKLSWDTKELFFKGQMIGQHIEFIDENRIILIEKVVNAMLLTMEEKTILANKDAFYKKRFDHSIRQIDLAVENLKDVLKIVNNIEVGMHAK